MCKQGTEKSITLTDGRKKSCDECIQPLVQALNDFGLQTIASCCGHGKQPVNIALTDGREIIIVKDWNEARIIDGLFPPLHSRPSEWKFKLRKYLARKLLAVTPI